MNKVILMGRLTRDPEIKVGQGSNATKVARFSLAVDRRFKNNGEDQADFIACVAFANTAEFVEKYGRKGTKFVIEGRIQTGSYTNKDGQKVYTTDVVVENVEFAESKKDGSSPQGQAPQGQPQYQQAPPQYGYQQQAVQGQPQYQQAPPQYGYQQQAPQGQPQYQQAPPQYQQPAPAPAPAPQGQPQMAPEGFAPVNGGDPFGLGMGMENYA